MADIPAEHALRSREEPLKNPLITMGIGVAGTAVKQRRVK